MLQAGTLTNEDTKQAWTGIPDIDNAINMLDRIDTLESCDDDRIEAVKTVLRRLAGNSPVIPDTWIPVSERMPDENAEQQVLACFKGGDISTLYYFEGRWDDAYGIAPIRQDVTHWMPLPAAPQEVEGE
nr:DUF551 domain-containing protein [Klebsiella pneumoniae]